MKVKALIECVGNGYNLKVDDVVSLEEPIVKKLVEFGYVEEVKTVRKPKERKVTE